MPDKGQVREKALEYLKGQALMVLATSDPDGAPYASTMLYVVDDDLNFYFITREDTKKARHLAANPKAALSIGCSSPMNIQAQGAVEMIEDETLRTGLFARLAEAGGKVGDFWPPILRIEAGDYLLFRIVPSWLRVLDLESENVNEAELPFTEIIP